MSHAFVKAWGPSGGSTSASAVTLTGGPIGTNGNGLFVLVQYQQSSPRAILTVKDQAGNSLNYRSAGTVDGDGTFYCGEYLLWIYNLQTTVTSVVVTLDSASSAGVQAKGWEFSGLSTADPGASFGSVLKATATLTADAVTSGNINATAQPGLLFGVSINSTNDGAPNAGTGFTDRGTAILTGAFGTYTHRAESKDIAATGNVAATFTNAGTSGQTLQTIAAYVIDQQPAATLSSPARSGTTDVSSTATVTSNTGGGTMYAAWCNTATVPTAAQIKAGGGNVVARASAAAVSGSNSLTTNALTASTTYYGPHLIQNNGLDSNIASVAGSFTTTAPAPSVTAVSSATPLDGSTLTITCSNGGATTGTVTLGGVTQTVTSWADSAGTTTIQITVNVGTNKYGVALGLVVTSAGGLTGATYNGVTGVLPQSGWSYINLGTLNADTTKRVTAVLDLASAEQLRYENKGGLVTMYSDGTFGGDNTVTGFLVGDNDGTGWGASRLQSLVASSGIGRVIHVSTTML